MATTRCRSPAGGYAEAFLVASPGAGDLDVAVARCGRGDEILQQVLGDVGDLIDGSLERGPVGRGRVRGTADLADILQGSGADLVGGGRRLQVVQDFDVAAHVSSLAHEGSDGAPRLPINGRLGCRSTTERWKCSPTLVNWLHRRLGIGSASEPSTSSPWNTPRPSSRARPGSG